MWSELIRIHDSSTIDLHGLSLHHALSVVKASCNSWWSGCTFSLSFSLHLFIMRTNLTMEYNSISSASSSENRHGNRETFSESESDFSPCRRQIIRSGRMAMEI